MAKHIPFNPSAPERNHSRGDQSSRRQRYTPQSLEAEQATIGAMLMELSAVDAARAMLGVPDFYRELHKTIFGCICDLRDRDMAVDIVTVADELRALDKLAECGGADYLSSLIEACPSSANVETYAVTVLECAQKRAFAYMAAELEGHAYNGKTAGDIRVWLQNRLEEVTARTTSLDAPREWNAAELMATEFPAARCAVEGLLPVGLTIFAGAPKIGKSWLSYNLALAVASGGMALGKFKVEAGEALYLALEDHPRRLKSRLETMLKSDRGTLPAPEKLILATEWQRFDQGGLQRLDAWLARHPDCRLVVVDTFQKVRPQRDGSNVYEEDYEHFAALKRIADAREVAIVVVLHTIKRDSTDVLQTIGGSTGQTGAADAIWVLQRQRNSKEAKLYITGREVEETELLLDWTPELGLYTAVDEDAAAEKGISGERAEVIEILREAQWPMAPRELAELLDKKTGAVRKLLWNMKRDGQVRALEGDKYALPDWSKNASVPPYPSSPSATPPATPSATPPATPQATSGPPYPDWLSDAGNALGEAPHVARNFWVFWQERYTNATLDRDDFNHYFPLWLAGQWPAK